MAAAQLCNCTSLSVRPASRLRPQQAALRPQQQRSHCRRPPLRVQAEFNSDVRPPKEVSQPPRQPEVSPARFGFNDNAERINSRACMIGFFALILVEAITGKGFLQLLGITVGRGIGFEI